MGTRIENRGQALRKIPSLDAFSRDERFGALPRSVVTRTCRAFLADVRQQVDDGGLDADADW